MEKLTIRLLGGIEIIASHQAQAAALNRKARALVAYLALQRGQPQSREKLAALFWENSPEEQARTNLRQTLSLIRKALNSDKAKFLVTEGDRVSLTGHNIDLDATQLEDLTADATPDALKQVAAIYKGDFLDGFSLKENSFEAWARTERERLRHLACDALTRLIAHCDEVDDTERCVETAARLLSLDPLREAAHRTLMRAYAAQGRQTSAMKQFETCRDILKRELVVEPEAKTVALYNDIRRQRMIPPTHGRETSPQPEPQGPALPDGPSVAVLPFESRSADTDQDYFADGLTENIITGLTRFRSLLVIALSSSFAVRKRALNVGQAATQLGVAHVVAGTVRKAANRVRVTVQLIDAATGHRVWAEHYDRDLDDIFSVQDEITNVIVATLAGRIEDADRQRADHKAPGDMTAYDHWLRGRHCLNSFTKDGFHEARRHFARALELEPGYARACADLSRSHLYEYEESWSEAPLQALDRSYQLAQKAVDLDAADSMARYALAWCCACKNQLELALVHIEKAVALNPNDYHILCAKSYFLALSGRFAEGIACSTEAMRLNPFAPDACLFSIGLAEFAARHYEEAIQAFGAVTSFVPMKRSAYLAACFAYLGRDEQARDKAAEVLELAPSEMSAPRDTDPTAWRAYWSKWYFFQTPDDLEHFLQGIRKAGLPA
jgi:TolB-like protein